tara:strand:- start:121 stop:642 length:522 start_codon:yes stop_codon:yes gene_type:complete
MRPRADEVLNSVIWSFDTYITPELEEPFNHSLALTIGNMLRNVLERIESEGQSLFDSNRELESVLLTAKNYINKNTDASKNNELKILPARIEEAIEKQFWTEEEYPSLERVTEKATLLRASLVEVIEGLQNAKNDLGEDEEYKELRVQIRHYLKNQLAREAKWSTEALQGLRR